MNYTAFSLILISAFLHALHSLFVKKSTDKLLFIALTFWGAWLMMGLCLPFFVFTYTFSPALFFTIIINSLLFTSYQYFTAKGYDRGEISVIYPLSMTGPGFVILWAILFFQERIGPAGFTGIALIVAGAVLISGLNAGQICSKRGWLTTGVLFGIAAAFFNSIGAVMEKFHVSRLNPYLFIWLLTGCMTVQLSLINIRNTGKSVKSFINNHKWTLIIASVIFAVSLPLYRYALEQVPVSYAVPVRRSSLLFGVLFGVTVLKEQFTIKKGAGAALIVLGIYLLN